MQPLQKGRWTSLHMWLPNTCMQVVPVHPKPWLFLIWECFPPFCRVGTNVTGMLPVLYCTVPYHTIPYREHPLVRHEPLQPHLWNHHHYHYYYTTITTLSLSLSHHCIPLISHIPPPLAHLADADNSAENTPTAVSVLLTPNTSCSRHYRPPIVLVAG